MTIPIDPVTGWFVRERSDYTVSDYAGRYQYWANPMEWSTTRRFPTVHKITWSGQGTKQFHGCEHIVTISNVNEGDAESRWLRTSGWGGADITNVGFIRGSWNELPPFSPASGSEVIVGYSPGYPSDPDTPQLDWGKARENLYADLFGRFPADTSVPLNILEFGQLRRLAPGFAKSLRELIDWCRRGPARSYKIRVRRIRNGRDRYLRINVKDSRVSLSSLRWGLKDLSSSWLATQFGLEPLIDDVTNWVTKYYQLKLKADWFNQLASSRPVHFHASTPKIAAANEVSQTCSMEWRYAPNTIYARNPIDVFGSSSVEIQGTLGCVAKVSPKTWAAQLNAKLASVLGMTAPLQTVWDIIPFSFVADWILPIGKTVAKVDQALFGSQGELASRVEILQAWCSTKATYRRGLRRPSGSMISSPSGRAPNQVQCTYGEGFTGQETRIYRRLMSWPDVSVWPTRKGWSTFASITSGALVCQRAFRNS